ncbi:MAG: bifunctional 3'-5' exonuclease/DNA polymerase, partial [Streptomycetaceae bacterium]|nr:bifunctional 3'-5' exonuclease/DNA polymerase [Streptomycetaceae bacterium]
MTARSSPAPVGVPHALAGCPRAALVPDSDGPGGRLQALTDDGRPVGEPVAVADVARAVAEVEASGRVPRWVWAAADDAYAPMLP